MANAKRDGNRVPTLVGISSDDGTTIIPVQVDSVTGRVLMKMEAQGSHATLTLSSDAKRDGNRVPVGLGVSENDDGVLVPIVVDSNNLRVKSA